MHIRQMTLQDIDAVRRIEAAAFGNWWRGISGKDVELSPRTMTNILSILDKDPQGCFVAEIDEKIVGFIFSRTWGSVGWFGTFSVLPEFQRQGIGKALIAASLEYLHQRPNRLIGLETMPESPYNLGLYLRQGFEARLPTLLLSKSLEPTAGEQPGLPQWSAADSATQHRWLAELRTVADQIHPGLDYSREIVTTAQRQQGTVWMLEQDSLAIGTSIVWHQGTREGAGEETAVLQLAILDPEETSAENFHTLIQASEAGAARAGKETLVIPVNTSHTWALDQLLSWGYRVERLAVRMVRKDFPLPHTAGRLVDLNRWAG